MIIPPLVLVTVRPAVTGPMGVAEPSNFTAMLCPAGNPDPVMDIVFAAAPIAPKAGDTAMEDTEVLKLVDAVL